MDILPPLPGSATPGDRRRFLRHMMDDPCRASFRREFCPYKSAGPPVQGEHLGGMRTSLPLDRIQKRSKDTRRTNAAHVTCLRQSIAVLGLIEPIVVDMQGRLIASGHRLEALLELRVQEPDAFAEFFPDKNIPVRAMNFDADQQPSKAMEIEIAENEQRRDYTPLEITNISKRLKEAGYRDNRGRPKAGERALFPALGAIVGKSYRRSRSAASDRGPGDPGTDSSPRIKKTTGSREHQ